MKYCIVFFTLLLISSCYNNDAASGTEFLIPTIYVLKSSPKVAVKNDVVFFQNKPYSGFLYSLQANNIDTASVEGFMNGVQHGLATKWYPNHQLMEQRMFVKGEKHGVQIAYWDNGFPKFEFTAQKDMYEGVLREWNIVGVLIHEANYKKGQEEGAQKLWYDNGKVRANYVMINGRRYGLLGTKNCMNVSDSIFNNK